jgi:hypothetical protein
VMASKFAGANDGDSDLLRFSRRVHSLLIPPERVFGSDTAM